MFWLSAELTVTMGLAYGLLKLDDSLYALLDITVHIFHTWTMYRQ